MMTKSKISFTIDKTVLTGIEKASSKYQIPKSRIAEDALKYWLKMKTKELMAKGYEDMAEEDGDTAEMAFHAQKEAVK
jgi:hypothetical protein